MQLANSDYGDSSKPFTIQLSFLGTGEIQLSGRHPAKSKATINRTAKTITFVSLGGRNYYGGTSPFPMTISITASPGYSASSIEFNWLTSSDNQAQYPTFEDESMQIIYEE